MARDEDAPGEGVRRAVAVSPAWRSGARPRSRVVKREPARDLDSGKRYDLAGPRCRLQRGTAIVQARQFGRRKCRRRKRPPRPPRAPDRLRARCPQDPRSKRCTMLLEWIVPLWVSEWRKRAIPDKRACGRPKHSVTERGLAIRSRRHHRDPVSQGDDCPRAMNAAPPPEASARQSGHDNGLARRPSFVGLVEVGGIEPPSEGAPQSGLHA